MKILSSWKSGFRHPRVPVGPSAVTPPSFGRRNEVEDYPEFAIAPLDALRLALGATRIVLLRSRPLKATGRG